MKVSEAAKAYHVTSQTITRWAKKGKIPFTETAGGHRRYNPPEQKPRDERQKVAYARVSRADHAEDLERQVACLTECYPDCEIIREIGSGIDNGRQNFRTILERLFDGNLAECVVCSGDRFARDFDFFEWLFSKFDSKLTSIHKVETRGTDDLTSDIMAVIAIYTKRYDTEGGGAVIEEDSDISDEESAPSL